MGCFALILGLECMTIESATWAGEKGGAISPPDWAPWTMISTGTVMVLYSFTLPKKMKS
jgi:hypothetical protein